MTEYKVGDKVLFVHFMEARTIDKIRRDGYIHLEGDLPNVWTHENCLKRDGEQV